MTKSADRESVDTNAANESRSKQHETEMQNARSFITAISRSLATIEFELDGTIVTANENFLKTLGYTLPEIQGQHHSMFVEADYAASREYEQFWSDLRRGIYAAGEFKRKGKGGKDIWIQASYNPLFDADGKPYKVVKVASDVTAQKVQASNWQGQLDAIHKSQAVIEFNLDGTILDANENFLKTVGYERSEIIGKHHRMFVDPAYAESAEYRDFWRRLSEGNFVSGEFRRISKAGKDIWIQASYNAILDLDGKPYKVVKFATDITAAKTLAFEVERRSKADQHSVGVMLESLKRVSKGDYSEPLDVDNDGPIGDLADGLRDFFQEKQSLEQKINAQHEAERRKAQETQRKVDVVLQCVSAMAEGNFSIEVPQLGDDAIGKVGSALGSAMSSMRGVLQQVRDVSAVVATASNQMSAVSREIASGAQKQAARLEETASSLEEITSTVKQNTDSAQQARQLANGSRDVAEQGGNVVSEAVDAMSAINSASKKIAAIITTIDEIAFQTNLLALNAAVEAARAGEQGRGFAVVAAEVRNLAQRSATAAKEIKGLIEDSVDKVENGTALVNKSGETLKDIVESVKRVTDIVAEIAAASQEQFTGVEQVNRAVSEMDRVTQANASQTEEMNGTCNSLLSHAEQLRSLVGRFRLSDAHEMQHASNFGQPSAFPGGQPQGYPPAGFPGFPGYPAPNAGGAGYGQPGNYPGANFAPQSQFGGAPGFASPYGQPGGYGQPAGYNQFGNPGQPSGFGQPGGQPFASNPPGSPVPPAGQPAPAGHAVAEANGHEEGFIEF